MTAPSPSTTTRARLREARRMAGVRPSAIRELLRWGADPDVISFGGGYPDPDLFPVAELHEVFSALLTRPNARVLQYAASDGLVALREQVAARMRADGTPCTTEEVLVLQGGQQGLDLSAKLVLDPGDVVVTENPTFLGALIAFAPCEPAYAPVRTDADGLDPDDLERVLAVTPGARLLYTVPDFQNPTGVTLTLERRRRLIELANAYDLLVVEDTPYRALRYAGEPLPTLRSLDTQGRVVHLGSFSKILAPGLRLGWAVADPAVIERLGLLKLAADTQSGTLAMAATSAYLAGYDIEAHLVEARALYRRKRDLMSATLRDVLPDGVSGTHPEGGLFSWLTFPDGFDAGVFLTDELLPKDKVAYVPGAPFFPVEARPQHARLSYSGMADEVMVEGLTRLGRRLHTVLG